MPPIVDWRHVSAADFRVPADRRLSDLTAELTELLGTPDSELRELALAVLCTWIERGVYDDLLPGLGDGIATGLLTGIGERGTDSVFRRSFSALVVAEVIDRDTRKPRVTRTKVHEWGDRLATWFLMERDERGWVADQGWAHAIAHGADAFGALARSPRCGPGELLVVLDVIGDRVTRAPGAVWYSGEHDRLAMTTLHVLRRGLVPERAGRGLDRADRGRRAPAPRQRRQVRRLPADRQCRGVPPRALPAAGARTRGTPAAYRSGAAARRAAASDPPGLPRPFAPPRRPVRR